MSSLPHHIIDNFLPDDVNRALLAHALDVNDFSIGKVVYEEELVVQNDLRKGLLSEDRLEPFLPQLLGYLRQAFTDICPALGMTAFSYAGVEYRLAAHGDGDFFSAHHDVLTRDNRGYSTRNRVITAVYYFHHIPRPFTGGELILHPFINGSEKVIEPRNNRLIAFPAMLMHEVKIVSEPKQQFANSRFSITFWYTRDRAQPA